MSLKIVNAVIVLIVNVVILC